MYVHTRLLGLDIEFGLQRAVRDLSKRSHAHAKRLVQQCALSGLTLLLIGMTTIVTLVWVVTAVAQNRAMHAAATYEPIPVTVAAPVGRDDVPQEWNMDELWAVQSDGY